MISVTWLPKRPVRSKQTQAIKLYSNHFAVDFIDSKMAIYVYSILISPEIPNDARELRQLLLKNATQAIRDSGLKGFKFSGQNLWSYQLKKEPISVQTKDDNNKKYTIVLSMVKEVNHQNASLQDIIQLFFSISNDVKDTNPLQQSVNVGIKDVLKNLELNPIDKSGKYFCKSHLTKNHLPNEGLFVLQGYKSTLKIYQGQPFLQIDFASRVLRDETALQFVLKFGSSKNKEAMIGLQGMSVLASYGSCRLYRVDGIAFNLNPASKFTLENGKETNYIDYYKSRYNVTIKDAKQPLIISRDKRNPKKIFYIIPELVRMTGITDSQKKNFKTMQAISQFTKLDPQNRYKVIQNLVDNLKKPLHEHNMKLQEQQMINGFKLVTPNLIGGNNKIMNANQSSVFMVRDNIFTPPGYGIKDWIMIYQKWSKDDDNLADDLSKDLIAQGAKLGIRIEEPYFLVMKDNDPRNWIDMLEQEIKPQPQLIVSISNDKNLYVAIKKFCLQKHGIIHQNVSLKYGNQKNKGAISSKICQQIAVKKGLQLWQVQKVQGIEDKIMIIGIDIYHKLLENKKSCLGFVAHFGSNYQENFSKVLLLEKGQELCLEIGAAFDAALQVYFKKNKFMPEAIVVYRDGVGESGVRVLLESEIAQFKRIITTYGENYKPQFAAIMINKKVNDRFFSQENKSIQNAREGTIIADKVVSGNFDFFLMSQYVTSGTGTPTHYTVLDNNTTWSENQFWQLTYNLCYNYQNWTGAVRVPSCVQYARKLAYLVGDTFQGDINKDLQGKLCFL